VGEKVCHTSINASPATNQETERVLLEQLKICTSESIYLETLWKLAWFYFALPNPDYADTVINAIMERTVDPEQQAACYHWLGEMAEIRKQYDAALEHYVKGFALNPKNTFTAYFLNNNTGYCLSLQGKHAAAERMCRLAIEIDPERPNAFKNLGISLAGQNDLLGAAWAWIEATTTNALDGRSLKLLQNLLSKHPDLIKQNPSLLRGMDACQRAVKSALQDLDDERSMQPEICASFLICELKYTPGNGFTRRHNKVESDTTQEEIRRLYTKEAVKMLEKNPNIWCGIAGEHRKNNASATKTTVDQLGNIRSSAQLAAWRRSLAPCLLLRGTALKRVGQN
jgi:tetratricopeptide (TPR) repeat protein